MARAHRRELPGVLGVDAHPGREHRQEALTRQPGHPCPHRSPVDRKVADPY